MLTLSLVVRKVSVIAISLIILEMKICTSITGWGDQTIRDLIQFATFSTNVRHVLCDLCENATWLAQFKNRNNFVLRSMTLPKCQCTADQYHLFDICCFWCVMTPLTGVYTAVLYINICCFISDFRPVINFNDVSSPKFVQSRKVLLMSAACLSKF